LLNAADGQGQIRSATYDVGFDELNATGTVIIQPLLPTQVGATFYLSSLPVHLVDFSLQKITNGVKIFWNVIDEVNMKHYELEFSNDASSFTRIATIIAKGKAIASYNYLHNGAVPNKVYYRIKMVNADGSFVYSPVRSISNKEEVSIKLYPNPANSFLVIESNISIKANARIINSFGAVVASINNIDFSSANKVSINVSQFKAGLYYLEYATANGNQAYPFIIANKK
jgi:hypothetical protein